MGKQKNNWIAIAAIAGLFAVALLYASGTLTLQSTAPKTDLRNLFAPYNLGQIEVTCKTAMGDWTQTPDFVGCQNIQGTTFNCNNPIIIAAREQCEAAGATFYCDSGNAYCEY